MKKARTKAKGVRLGGKHIPLAKLLADRTASANKALEKTNKVFRKIERDSEVSFERMNTPFNV